MRRLRTFEEEAEQVRAPAFAAAVEELEPAHQVARMRILRDPNARLTRQ